MGLQCRRAAKPMTSRPPAKLTESPRLLWFQNIHLDRPFGTAVDKLIDIRVSARIDRACRALPDDLAFVDHCDTVRDLARRCHVVGDGDRRGTEPFDRIDNEIV